MTTARNTWRSRSRTAFAAGVIALAVSPASAHRRDEYLQAARIAIDPGRVQIELDLTPGIAIAPGLLPEIDRDGNGSFNDDEARAYAARVLGEIQFEIDDKPRTLALVERRFPSVSAVLNGEGTIQLRLAATLPSLTAGAHRVFFRNVHHPAIGVYLANALVPDSERVTVLDQKRDVNQRELTIEYTLRDGAADPVRGWLPVGVAITVALMASAWWRSRSGS